MKHTDVQKAHGFVMCWLSWDWLGSSWKLIDTSNLVVSKALSAVSLYSQQNQPTHPLTLLGTYLPNLVIRREICLIFCTVTQPTLFQRSLVSRDHMLLTHLKQSLALQNQWCAGETPACQ
jgi:hypothetical protein